MLDAIGTFSPFPFLTKRGVCAAFLTGAFLCLTLATPAAAQEGGTEALDELSTAIAAGDVSGIVAHAADRIDISILGAGALYSRSQARYVLEEFFRDHQPVRFSVQELSQRDGNWFASGSYWSVGGASRLTMYLRLKQKDGGWELRELRVDRRSLD